MRALALTIDLDSPTDYAGLHGVTIDAEDPLLMYRAPLARFAELCRDLGGPGTIFAVGRDVVGVAAQALHALTQDGFEIGNHSHLHDYQLTRRSPGAMLADVCQAQVTLEREVGVRPVGFRAPGYRISAALFDQLEAVGLRYDTSVLPSPPYYATKLLVLLAYWLASRPSTAMLGSPRTAFAPTSPYRPGRDPYVRGKRALWELPVSVSTPLHLPVTGAAIVLAPPWLRARMALGLAAREVVIINFHGVDFVDVQRDAFPVQLVHHQPELRWSLGERLAFYREFIHALLAGRELCTCARIAQMYAKS